MLKIDVHNYILLKRISVIFLLFICANICFAQKPDCFEIKHLDFFGLNQDYKINLSDEELDKITNNKLDENSYWLIPPLVFQLKNFHPNCNLEFDKKRYDKLINLYFKVKRNTVTTWENKTVEEQLNFIREDFYQQLYDEKVLPYMRYTMDDGPIYGEIPKAINSLKKGKSITTSFGKITIAKSKNKVFLIASNKQNKVIWSRIMMGDNPKRYLQNLEFQKKPLEETSFATVVYLQTSERLTLYLKTDGKFICYFHSW